MVSQEFRHTFIPKCQMQWTLTHSRCYLADVWCQIGRASLPTLFNQHHQTYQAATSRGKLRKKKGKEREKQSQILIWETIHQGEKWFKQFLCLSNSKLNCPGLWSLIEALKEPYSMDLTFFCHSKMSYSNKRGQ